MAVGFGLPGQLASSVRPGLQQVMGVRQQPLPFGGHLDIAPGTEKQRDPQGLLQLTNTGTDRRGRNKQFIRSTPEVSGLGHFQKGSEQFNIHGRPKSVV